MRIRLPLGRSLFFAVALLIALVALLPLRLALGWLGLDERGFAAREARGSVWLGRLAEAQVGSVALGDLDARLAPLPLAIGRARVELGRDEESNPFRGAATVSRRTIGIDDMTARIDLGPAFAPLPVALADLSQVSVRFEDGVCQRAEGLVKASVAGDVAGLALGGGLSGNARCEGGALLLPLVSQTGMEALRVRIAQDGTYEVELSVRPSDDAVRDRLTASGFRLGANGYVLSATGSF